MNMMMLRVPYAMARATFDVGDEEVVGGITNGNAVIPSLKGRTSNVNPS